MYRISLLILIIFISFLSLNTIAEGRDKKVATTACPFLKIGVGARACSLGEAFVGLSDDASAIYWNPAGLAQLSQPEFLAIHNHWFSNINQEFIAYAGPVNENAVLGIGTVILYIDDLERRTAPTIESEGIFSASDTLLIISFASKLPDKRIILGGSGKIILQKIESKRIGNLAFDLGGLYQVDDKLKLGIVFQNIGFKSNIYKEDFSLPGWFKIGLAQTFLQNYLTATADMTLYKDNNPTYSAGIEYTFKDILFLRAGYRKKSSEPSDGILSGLTSGAGFRIKSSQIDYAYVPYDDIGNSHRISLTVRF